MFFTVILLAKLYGYMESNQKYLYSNRMRDLIDDNSSILMVMSRFGISLGFGDKNIKEICEEQGVDTNTFLAVANFISNKGNDYKNISLKSLIEYLKRAHSYFLDFNLPTIRRRLLDAIDYSEPNDVAAFILKFYDEYVTEVRRHMEYENKTVFAYVYNLLNNQGIQSYSISAFASKHNKISKKLKELKDIIIRYYPEKENDLLNAVLFDIINCEQDLISHCLVEDHIFIPAVEEMETIIKAQEHKPRTDNLENELSESEKLEALSQREIEIIGCVARGLTNKEIANELCLSIHTVTTHRRNISSKLQIHTPAGLTIYAIINKLVKLQDIKLT